VGPTRAYFATRDSVQDLEALRQGLGVERFALGGISYGTYVTQYYARDYPSRVSHMVLDSVVDPAGFNGLDAPMFAAISPALNSLCAASRCRGITPDPVGDLAGLVAATASQPIRGFRVTESGARVRASIGGPGNQGDLPTMLVAGDFSSTLRALWPGAARAARNGDAAPMLRLGTLTAGSGAPTPPSEISSALFYATVCSDSALAWTTATPIAQRPGMVRPAAEALGAAAFAPFSIDNAVAASNAESCTQWPEAATDPLGTPALPAVPTILLDGGQDLRTPVASAQAVAARIPGAALVVAPGAGHSLLYQYSCAQVQMRNLLYGRRVSTAACNREAPVPRPIPVPPANLSAVSPSGARGTAGRVANAARYAVQDGVLAMDAASEAGLPALPGLRAGVARSRDLLGAAISYSRFSAVRGVGITGTLRFNGRTFQGTLRVNGPGAWDGTLYLARGGERAYTGSIGGVPVRIPLG
jgi:pimeloyl-ACP methyl ester carboxylesterase